MNNFIAFMCTGQDTGFDPICNTTDTLILLAVVANILLAVFAGIGLAVHKYRKSRNATASRSMTLLLASLGTAGFLVLLFLVLGARF